MRFSDAIPEEWHLWEKYSRGAWPHSPPRNAIFRPSIPALSRLHPLPFASRYLSPRNPKHAQRPRHPSLTAFPPVPFRLRPPKTVPSRPLFHPKFQPHISTKYLYHPPLCPIAKMIMRNVMGWVRYGHAQYSATRNGMKRRAADGKLRQTDGQA